ncbi:MAG: hypothetical protein LUE92_16680, partial [Clostridiales bacterium]|nr:hypothetical protein [Clostridiales bacterium]
SMYVGGFLQGFCGLPVLGVVIQMACNNTIKNTGVAVSILASVQGMAMFIADYLANAVNALIGGSFITKFYTGMVMCILAAVIYIICGNKINRIQKEAIDRKLKTE